MKRETFKKVYARTGAMALTMALLLQSPGGILSLLAAEKADAGVQTQMSSDPETVYMNGYNDPSIRSQDFNSNWKFYLGDPGSAQEVAFDDSRWDSVDLPHDYSIDQAYSSSMEGESAYLPGGTGWYRKHFTLSDTMKDKRLRIDFDGVYMNSTVWVNGTQLGTHPYGYTPFSFDITDYVNFGGDNVITVKVDHRTPSSRWYSGSGIYRDVTLVVTDPVHVDLYGTEITTPDLKSEVASKSKVTMKVKTTVANANAETAEVVLTHTVFEKGGSAEDAIGTVTTSPTSVAAGTKEIEAEIEVDSSVKLWTLEKPVMYTVRTEVKTGDKIVDTYDTDFGFRYFEFNGNNGFSLNGKYTKLKGVCMHHDQGSLGSVSDYRAIERQIEILQEMGCNSIRTSHNPASKELIQICNEKGMLLLEEIFDGWGYAKNGNIYDYSTAFAVKIQDTNQIIGAQDDMTWAEFDINAAIGRDYNAPSIIMWSIGNEIWTGVQGGIPDSYWTSTAASLTDWVKAADDTRPITMGDNQLRYGVSANSRTIAQDMLASSGGAMIGINYPENGSSNYYDIIHNQYPDWPLYGSEAISPQNSRGVYNQISITGNQGQTTSKQLTSYDYSCVSWGTFASFGLYNMMSKDYAAGEYVWTGFDYLGEPTPWNGTASGPQGAWPSPKNSYFGIVDTAGFPKDSFYLYQSQWNEDVTTLHILPAWNEDVVASANNGVPVVVYSDAKAVELFLTPANGGERRSLGKKEFTKHTTPLGYTYQLYEGSDKDSVQHRNLYLTWHVPFEAGTITAVAYDENNKVISNTQGRSSVTTTGEEAKLQISADRDSIKADGRDLAYITVDVTDAEGNIVPDADDRVTFTVTGDGELAALDNGNAADHDSYRLNSRQAFSGKVLAIVRATKEEGSFTVKAEANGLEAASITVKTTAVEGETVQGKQVESFRMARNYYVKVGNMPQLPETIKAYYADGTQADVAVAWEKINNALTEKPGSFTVTGTIEGIYSVSVVVNMIDTVAAVKNYSTTTSVGVPVVLPDSRPAVMQDGTVMDIAFQVTWDEVDENAYDTEGTIIVNGTAEVFGSRLGVTASIRVQNEQLQVGQSVSGLAAGLEQNITGSDNLDAVKNGVTIPDNIGDNKNERWSNYDDAQAGTCDAELTFWYLAPQTIGEVVIYFYQDNWSSLFPEEGQIEIFVSESNTGNWTKVEATETIGEELADGMVRAHTYSFDPVTGTYIKIRINGKNDTIASTNQKVCTAITEIELKDVSSAAVVNKEAALASLKINGVELTEEELASGKYSTSEKIEEIEAVGAGNAAVTVLPEYNGQILILIESEDHNTTGQFVITLSSPTSDLQSISVRTVQRSVYMAGESFDPEGLELTLVYEDGNTSRVVYSEENASQFTFVPALTEKLTEEDKQVTVTYQGKSAVIEINVKPEGALADRTELQKKIGEARALDKLLYTEESWNAMQEVLRGAMEILNNADVSQEEVDAAVEALNTAIEALEENTLPFVDIPDQWYHDAVSYVYYNKLMTGKDETHFAPGENLARAQFAVILHRMNSAPQMQYTDQFPDVQEGIWYTDAILWAASTGVVTGYTSNGHFGPADNITREQMAVMMYRYAGYKEYDRSQTQEYDGFQDADKVSKFAADAMKWAVASGIITGKDSGTRLDPQGNASRAECAIIIQRFMEKYK